MCFAIWIKIYAENPDMVPMAKRVCQLRPIGWSPGVPDKTTEALGYMSRYSAHILIFFIAYIFPFSTFFSVGWFGSFVFQDCLQTVLYVHCDQNEAVTKANEISQHSLHELKGCRIKLKTLTFMPQNWWNWSRGLKSFQWEVFQSKNQVNRVFLHTYK